LSIRCSFEVFLPVCLAWAPAAWADTERLAPAPWWQRQPVMDAPWGLPPDPRPYGRGEFEPIDGVWITAWEQAQAGELLGLVEALAKRAVPVHACGRDEEDLARSQEELEQAGLDGALRWWDCGELNTIWIRDYAPVFSQSAGGLRMAADLQYYSSRPADDHMPPVLADILGAMVYPTPLSLEGGNLLRDGQGGCVTSTILQSQWINPGLAREDLEAVLQRYLGCERVSWLEPLEGEGTGHVDLFAAFLDGQRILLGSYDAEYDPVNAALLDDNAQLLERAGYEVLRLPMPHHDDGDGDGIDDFRSYLNALPVASGQQGSWLVPVFDDATEREGEFLDGLAAVAEGWEVVPLDSSSLVMLGGALHCVAVTLPSLAWSDPCGDAYAFNDDDPACGSEPPGTCSHSGPVSLPLLLAPLLLLLRRRPR